MWPETFEISQCGNNLIQIAPLPLESGDYPLKGHAGRKFYHAQGDSLIPLPKIGRHNGDLASYRRKCENSASVTNKKEELCHSQKALTASQRVINSANLND
jgi:hypothetical protein